MTVTGGLVWWNEFIVTACYNLSDRQEEVRWVLRKSNFLSHLFCAIQKFLLREIIKSLISDKV